MLRVLSRALYHDIDWRVLSSPEIRLFTVISYEEMELHSTIKQFNVVNPSNDITNSNDNIAIAKITIEVIGKENIIQVINNLLKYDKLKDD